MVIGSGWGGYEFVRRLPRNHPFDVTIVTPRPYFVFTPLLASTCVGTLEFRAAAESVRNLKGVKLIDGWAQNVDLDGKTASGQFNTTSKPFSVDFDRLVLACGSVTATYNTPGISQHALFLKDIDNAKRIRRRILDCFDRAEAENNPDLVHFAIIGGGPTGVELAAEIHDLISQDLCRVCPKAAQWATITIYDVAKKILSGFDAHLMTFAEEKFKRRGIQVETGIRVKQVNENSVEFEDGRKVMVGMIVWVTGITTNDLVKHFKADLQNTGVVVNQRLQIIRDGKVIQWAYALGDCSSIQDNPLPRTAQVAKQQAAYLAKSSQT